MAYVIDCSCGKQLHISAAQAGSTAACACGRKVAVPRLSHLRQSAGQGAYESSCIDVVRRLIREGELPAGSICQSCGANATGIAHCTVVCEWPWVESRDGGSWRWMLFLVSWWAWLFAHFLFPEKPDEHNVRVRGREVTIDVPLRMCGECSDRWASGKFSKSVMAHLLLQHPATAQLLRDFPDAQLFPVPRR